MAHICFHCVGQIHGEELGCVDQLANVLGSTCLLEDKPSRCSSHLSSRSISLLNPLRRTCNVRLNARSHASRSYSSRSCSANPGCTYSYVYAVWPMFNRSPVPIPGLICRVLRFFFPCSPTKVGIVVTSTVVPAKCVKIRTEGGYRDRVSGMLVG